MAGKEDTVEEAKAAFLASKEGRASQETVVVTEIVSAAAVHHLVEFALLLTTTTTTGTKKNRRSVVKKMGFLVRHVLLQQYVETQNRPCKTEKDKWMVCGTFVSVDVVVVVVVVVVVSA